MMTFSCVMIGKMPEKMTKTTFRVKDLLLVVQGLILLEQDQEWARSLIKHDLLELVWERSFHHTWWATLTRTVPLHQELTNSFSLRCQCRIPSIPQVSIRISSTSPTTRFPQCSLENSNWEEMLVLSTWQIELGLPLVILIWQIHLFLPQEMESKMIYHRQCRTLVSESRPEIEVWSSRARLARFPWSTTTQWGRRREPAAWDSSHSTAAKCRWSRWNRWTSTTS